MTDYNGSGYSREQLDEPCTVCHEPRWQCILDAEGYDPRAEVNPCD